MCRAIWENSHWCRKTDPPVIVWALSKAHRWEREESIGRGGESGCQFVSHEWKSLLEWRAVAGRARMALASGMCCRKRGQQATPAQCVSLSERILIHTPLSREWSIATRLVRSLLFPLSPIHEIERGILWVLSPHRIYYFSGHSNSPPFFRLFGINFTCNSPDFAHLLWSVLLFLWNFLIHLN